MLMMTGTILLRSMASPARSDMMSVKRKNWLREGSHHQPQPHGHHGGKITHMRTHSSIQQTGERERERERERVSRDMVHF